MDVVDNAHTIIDPDASLFEKGVAAIDLATGFGDEVKWFAKAVGFSDAAIDAIDNTKAASRLRERAEIGQEAHRQIQGELIEAIPGTKTEVTINLGDKVVRKDAVKPDGTVVIIKPDTPSGRSSAAKRKQLMENNGYQTDSRWLPGSPTYIGPQR